MPQRALITGVAGFVGGHLAEYLLDSGDAVLGCSIDGQWLAGSPAALAARVALVAMDLGRPDGLSPAGRRAIQDFAPTCLYHLAALSVPEDCGDREPAPRAVAVNVDGTRRVLELAAGLPSRPRLLFVSTSHVYAPVASDSPRIDETAPLGPAHAYGRTKLAGEQEVGRAICRDGCDAVIARAFHHAGPRQDGRLMLSQWAKQFAAGGTHPVQVYTRDAHLDLSDVRDVIRAYRLLLERGRPGEAYNVGSGVSRSSGEILDQLRRLADPHRAIVEIRPGFRQEPIADISRLIHATGWQPQVPIQQTIADTLDWWRAQVPR
jgi:GDP-4-dehydro-6-deoxy-D-mannose reductase